MRVRVEGVTKVIKGRTVLDNVSLSLDSGSIYGLRGKNGAGKTMLLRALCGLVLPTSGRVLVDGAALGEGVSFPPSVGVLIESPGFINGYSGLKNLRVIASINRRATEEGIAGMMRLFGLDPLDKKKVRAYSLGMRQKLGICAALMEGPELILLDEPINSLDEASAEKVLGVLTARKEAGALIVVASHDREELDFLADEAIEMRDGAVVPPVLAGGGS
jgi:ABC-2 type transport system ATP-binding protein